MDYGNRCAEIEEEKRHYDCMVLAVSGGVLWEVRDELAQYDINKLVMISPLMDDGFNGSSRIVLSDKCKISKQIYIADDVQIVTDETSSICIEDEVSIGNGCVIIAMNNSEIYIGKRSCISGKNSIIAEDYSRILLDGCNINIAMKTFINSTEESVINIKNKCNIANDGLIACAHAGSINIGEGTTIGSHLYMVSENKTKIIIGDDCMLSYYVKLNAGSHRLTERRTQGNITNVSDIKIGNHVWCGMGALLLPGCYVETGSVVGAASLVNEKIPGNVTCAGNKARVLRKDIE